MRFKSNCKWGHPLSGDNLYISSKGVRGCRACRCKYAIQAHKKNPEDRKRYARNWKARELVKTPDRFRNYHFVNDYGITVEERNAKAEQQNSCCMICRRMLPLEVDHDHDTEQIRDLLCRPCNLAVGLIREDIEIAENLVAYLKKWKTCLN
jgi:hypothetical protein